MSPSHPMHRTANPLRLTTIQAPNQDFIIRDLSAYVRQRLGIETHFVGDPPWHERLRLLDSGQIDVAWICGLPYVIRADTGQAGFELLAAPVMDGTRYQNKPIYYSDVIVRSERSFQSFADLHRTIWAYNEPGSQSGFNITRYHLATIDAPYPFFERAIQAGSHEHCIQLVLNGEVDAAAIDSTVLELAREQDGDIHERLRVLASLGPSPIPPLVISLNIDPRLRQAIRALILEMHKDARGREILGRGKIRRFQQVKDSDYDPIRDMARKARGIQL